MSSVRVVVGLVGLLFGAQIGGSIETDRWERYNSTDSARLSFRSGGDLGVGAALSAVTRPSWGVVHHDLPWVHPA